MTKNIFETVSDLKKRGWKPRVTSRKFYVSECPDTGRQFLAEVGKDNNIIELTRANVRRVAALPDLIAALQQVLIASEDNGDMDDIDWSGIRTALAKAGQ